MNAHTWFFWEKDFQRTVIAIWHLSHGKNNAAKNRTTRKNNILCFHQAEINYRTIPFFKATYLKETLKFERNNFPTVSKKSVREWKRVYRPEGSKILGKKNRIFTQTFAKSHFKLQRFGFRENSSTQMFNLSYSSENDEEDTRHYFRLK